MLRNYVILYVLRNTNSLKNFCKSTSFLDTDKYFFYLVDIQFFLFPIEYDGSSGEDKQIVGKTVEIAEEGVVDFGFSGECDDTAFCTTADGTSNVALGADEVAAGNDEVVKLGELVCDGVDLSFKHLYFLFGELGETGVDGFILGGQKSLEGE